MNDKASLRRALRAKRRDHVAALPENVLRLLFLRPPAPVVDLLPEGATVGLYHAHPHEAPTASYAKWFAENGRVVATPWFESRQSPMQFRAWSNPYDDGELIPGPFGALQPRGDAPELTPDVVFVPLIGFTARGERLGQGGGHYDRWLAAHPDVATFGLAWDCQQVDALPVEPHDALLRAVITPTRIYEAAP